MIIKYVLFVELKSMRIIHVPPDGNCFYHCVSKIMKQLLRHHFSHQECRSLIADLLDTVSGKRVLRRIIGALPKEKTDRLSEGYSDLFPFLLETNGSCNIKKVKVAILKNRVYASELEVLILKKFLDTGFGITLMVVGNLEDVERKKRKNTCYLLLRDEHYDIVATNEGSVIF